MEKLESLVPDRVAKKKENSTKATNIDKNVGYVKNITEANVLKDFDTTKPLDFTKMYIKEQIKAGKF